MTLFLRQHNEQHEIETLAPYALKAAVSKGRRYRESEHEYRTCFQRDRDRVVHSDAFRRLEYKTQVFLNWAGDHFRTRLTHSIEVAQCARIMARALRLNEEVCEAVALAHDLGHTPFGHAGEEAMRECMKSHGGYEHNGQSLRIVDWLELRYPEFPGLNLTHEVRYGLMKHETDYDKPLFSALQKRESASLEAQIVNFADEISYNAHDCEDGLYAGILTLDGASSSVLFAEARKAANDRGIKDQDLALMRYFITGYLKNAQVSDLITATAARLQERRFESIDDVIAYRGPRVVAFSPDMAEKVKRLKHMLYNQLYKHRRVLRSMEKATRFMKQMFERYVDEPILMPGGFYRRVVGVRGRGGHKRGAAPASAVAGSSSTAEATTGSGPEIMPGRISGHMRMADLEAAGAEGSQGDGIGREITGGDGHTGAEGHTGVGKSGSFDEGEQGPGRSSSESGTWPPVSGRGVAFGDVDGEPVHRVVCDYISGMTDRYALEQYKKLFDPDVW